MVVNRYVQINVRTHLHVLLVLGRNRPADLDLFAFIELNLGDIDVFPDQHPTPWGNRVGGERVHFMRDNRLPIPAALRSVFKDFEDHLCYLWIRRES